MITTAVEDPPKAAELWVTTLDAETLIQRLPTSTRETRTPLSSPAFSCIHCLPISCSRGALPQVGVFTHLQVTWLALGVLVASAPTQLWLLNWALGSGKASFTVPLYTVMIISTNIVLGGLLFDEFACLSRAYLFVCAFVMVVVGVCLLSWGQERAKRLAAGQGTPRCGDTHPRDHARSHEITRDHPRCGAPPRSPPRLPRPHWLRLCQPVRELPRCACTRTFLRTPSPPKPLRHQAG